MTMFQGKQNRVKANTMKTEGLDNPDEKLFTIHEEKDHESWRQFHRQQKLKRQHEHLHFAKRGVDQEIMFEDDVFNANMDGTAFANILQNVTKKQLKSKSRELAEWIQEEENFPNPRRSSQDSCPCVVF